MPIRRQSFCAIPVFPTGNCSCMAGVTAWQSPRRSPRDSGHLKTPGTGPRTLRAPNHRHGLPKVWLPSAAATPHPNPPPMTGFATIGKRSAPSEQFDSLSPCNWSISSSPNSRRAIPPSWIWSICAIAWPKWRKSMTRPAKRLRNWTRWSRSSVRRLFAWALSSCRWNRTRRTFASAARIMSAALIRNCRCQPAGGPAGAAQ
jgi:hypothetical protein